MSDQVNDNHPECCVCLEPALVKAETPCNHPEPGVAPIEFSDDEPESDDIISDYNRALVSAARSGHEALVRLLLDRGATSYNRAMRYAAAGGHEPIVRLLLDRGATDYDGALISAARGAHESIVRLMLDLDEALYRATWHGCENILNLLKDRMNSIESPS